VTSRAEPPPVRYAVERRGVDGFLDAWHALGGTSERVAAFADLERRTDADPATVLVHATAAVAQTGSVVIDSRRNARAASLLPDRAVFVIDVATVVDTTGDVLRHRDRWWPDGLPSQIVFVTGPSRSADIEMTLTVGVHGPGRVHAVLIG
jgi:L-lactate utilization protein LutC